MSHIGGNKIPIVLAADNNYIIPLCVCLTSILENKNDNTYYDFHILIPSEFLNVNKDIIIELIQRYNNCNSCFVQMENEFSDLKIVQKHISVQTFYRLLIPESLPKSYSKAIYLDSDTIVNTDLTELFSTDIFEYYLAGVLHPVYYFNNLILRKESLEYINAGVLLLNLDKLRADSVQEQFLKLIPQNLKGNDQDIINIVCNNKIKFLPFKYNVMPKCKIFVGDKKISKIYDEKKFKEAFENPAIIHWANPEKPWEYKDLMFFEYWSKYFKLSPVNDRKLNLRSFNLHSIKHFFEEIVLKLSLLLC